jgi:hypothetical protein
MSNLRIKDIPIVATSTVSDDYFIIDGQTSGTRRLSAYSLTLNSLTLTNLIVSNATINGGAINGTTIGASIASTGAFTTISASSTTDSSSILTGAVTVAGGLGVAKKLYVGSTGSFGGAVFVGDGNLSLKNAYFVAGRNAADTAYQALIGFTASDKVSIDPNGYGSVFGGGITVSGGTITGGVNGLEIVAGVNNKGVTIYGGLKNLNYIALGGGGNIDVVAGGTNQNVTLTPSGTGIVNTASNITTTGGTIGVGQAIGVGLDIIGPVGAANDAYFYNRRPGQLTLGTNNQSVFTASATGGTAVSAIGTNQNITLTPSGSGIVSTASPISTSSTTAATAVNTGALKSANYGFSGNAGGASFLGGSLTLAGDSIINDTTSVTGALNNRMAMQGVEFNGGVIAGTNLAKGTGDNEVLINAFITAYPSAGNYIQLLPIYSGSRILVIDYLGRLYAGKDGTALAASPSLTVVPLNRCVILGYRKASSVGTYLIDSKDAGTTPDTFDYSGTGIGNMGQGAPAGSKLAHPVDLNTTLTTAERANFVATQTLPGRVYVPNGAGSTLTSGNYFTGGGGSALGSFSSTGTTFTGTTQASGTQVAKVSMIPATANTWKSKSIRIVGTLTVTGGTLTGSRVTEADSSTGLVNLPLVTGAVDVTFVGNGASGYIEFGFSGSNGTTVAFSGTCTALGVTCELDPRWSGIGLTWPDLSGAARHATLPATGVTPIIPNTQTYADTVTGGTSGLTLNAGGTNQSVTIMPSGTGAINIARSGDTNRQLTMGYSPASEFSFVSSVHQGTAYRPLSLNQSGGNVLVGTSTDDGLNKLQVQGDVRIKGNVGLLEGPSTAAFNIVQNAYYSSGWKYRANGAASQILMNYDTVSFGRAGSGSADGGLTWLTSLTLGTDGAASFGSTTAATAVNTGAIKTPNMGHSGNAGGPTYFLGNVTSALDIITSATTQNTLAALANQPNAPVYSGSQSRGAYANLGIGQTTVPPFFAAWADMPSANPAAGIGIWIASPSGVDGGARAIMCWINSSGSLQVYQYATSGSNFRRASVSGFITAFGGKRVLLIVDISSAGALTITANGVTQTYVEETGGTPPAWVDARDFTYFDSGSLGSANTFPGYLRAALGLGELTAAARAQIAAGKGWEAWMTPTALGESAAGTQKLTGDASTFAASAGGWDANGNAVAWNAGGYLDATGMSGTYNGARTPSTVTVINGCYYSMAFTTSSLVGGSTLSLFQANGVTLSGNFAAGTRTVIFKATYTGRLIIGRNPSDTTTAFSLDSVTLQPLGLIAELDGSANVAPGATTWNNPHGPAFVLPATGWTSAKPFSNAESFTNGYSVTGALNSRMAMQGVEFNGGVIAGTNLAKGTGDFEVFLNAYLTSYAEVTLIPKAANSFSLIMRATGLLQAVKDSVAYVPTASNTVVPLNKWVLLGYRRVSGVGYYTINGQEAGSTVDTSDYSANGTANLGTNAPAGSKLAHPVDLNTTLTTTERANFVATQTLPSRVYVPGGAGTDITAGGVWINSGYGTFSSANADSFSAASSAGAGNYFAVPNGAGAYIANIGNVFRYSFTINVASGQVPQLSISGGWVASSALVSVAATAGGGATTISGTFTATATGSNGSFRFYSTADTSYSVSSFKLAAEGVTCELDPRWDGRGSIWPDISGAGRHGVLPASGVVPIIAPMVASPKFKSEASAPSCSEYAPMQFILSASLASGTAYTAGQVLASVSGAEAYELLGGLFLLQGERGAKLYFAGGFATTPTVTLLATYGAIDSNAGANASLTCTMSGAIATLNITAAVSVTMSNTNTVRLYPIGFAGNARLVK